MQTQAHDFDDQLDQEDGVEDQIDGFQQVLVLLLGWVAVLGEGGCVGDYYEVYEVGKPLVANDGPEEL